MNDSAYWMKFLKSTTSCILEGEHFSGVCYVTTKSFSLFLSFLFALIHSSIFFFFFFFFFVAMITSEPEWLDSLTCQFCQVKFNVKIRKHHCRHCGRIGCSQCLPKTRQFPIQKFEIMKPERLCAPCYDVISNPSAN
jgi:hypothetical protein